MSNETTTEKATSTYSISDVQGSSKPNEYIVTITHGGISLGEVTIKATSTAAEDAGSSKSK